MRPRALVVTLMLAVSCSGGTSFDSVEDLQQGLADEGIECSELDIDFRDPFENGDCNIGDEFVTLSVFEDDTDKGRYIGENLEGGVLLVEGENWIVGVERESTAEAIADALGAEIHS